MFNNQRTCYTCLVTHLNIINVKCNVQWSAAHQGDLSHVRCETGTFSWLSNFACTFTFVRVPVSSCVVQCVSRCARVCWHGSEIKENEVNRYIEVGIGKYLAIIEQNCNEEQNSFSYNNLKSMGVLVSWMCSPFTISHEIDQRHEQTNRWGKFLKFESIGSSKNNC